MTAHKYFNPLYGPNVRLRLITDKWRNATRAQQALKGARSICCAKTLPPDTSAKRSAPEENKLRIQAQFPGFNPLSTTAGNPRKSKEHPP